MRKTRRPSTLLWTAVVGSGFTLLTITGCGGGSSSTSKDPFVFVADLDGSQIDVFSLTPTAGTLTGVTGTPFASDYRPISVVVHPTKDTFYVANNGNSPTCGSNGAPGSITSYSYDTTGTPTKIAEHCLPDSPTQLLITSDGSTVLALMPGTGQIATLSTGGMNNDVSMASTITVAGGAHPTHMTLTSDGKTVYAADPLGLLTILSVNGTTLAEATGSPVTLADKADDLACCNGGNLYVVDANARNLVQYAVAVSGGTATATRGTAVATDQFPNHVMLINGNKNLLVTNMTVGQLSLFGVDATSGAPTAQTMQVVTGTYPTCIFVDPSNTYFYVTNYHANTVNGYQLSSGVLSSVGSGTTGGAPICGAAAHPA